MVVAIGGSAGALDAVRGVIAELPSRSGMAYILVQHLDPDHPSVLAELLGEETPFPVIQAADGMDLLPDRLHVIPSGTRLTVAGGVLRLIPATRNEGPRLPIDFLFESLAAQSDLRVVAVLLSGNGTDGAIGVRALHDAGAYIIAQDPGEADFSSIPAAAIATGFVDAVLPVAAIPAAIAERANAASQPMLAGSEWVAPALERLKNAGHDFTGYKVGTMQRRIERRARLNGHGSNVGSSGAEGLAAYVKLLDHDEDELNALAADMLINVTGFFRDHSVFETLANVIVPDLVRSHDDDRPLRIWCAGCSTGEEAWSLAILVLEEIARGRPGMKLQLFATDLDADAVTSARRGLYPATIEGEVSTERLQRYFTPDDLGWRVGPALQSSVVFAVHDLLTDPPFSRIDMVSCRNLLIYLQPPAQARAVAMFHFALNPGGMLLLGKAESVAEPVDSMAAPAFTLVSRQAHVYRRGATKRPMPLPIEPGQAASAFSRLAAPMPEMPSARLGALEAELASIRATIAKADEQLGDTDPELRAIEADTLSRNQEYQSTNEELITSQEELQSLNEELVALNGQLQETIDRQRTMADDLHNILNSTNIATIFLDLDMQIRFFTPATRALFNMLPSDIGRPFTDLAPIIPDPDLARDIAAVRAGRRAPDREVEAEAGICFNRRVLAYRAHDDHAEGVIITYSDVSDRKRAQRITQEAREAAEAANLAKSRFLAAASHDLRQPLQSMVLLQELLSSKVSDPAARKLLVQLEHTVGSMTAMLDGLLDINRLDADAVDVVTCSFPLETLFAEIVESLTMQANAGKLKLRHVPTSCHVVSDRGLLAGMVRNLVANALKYTVKGGVVLGARRRGDSVRIEVWDSGIGIPASKVETIFKPYEQLEPALADRSRGLGLGLAIVRSMGEMLDHKIDVRSWAPDGDRATGSVFAITAPLALVEAEDSGVPQYPIEAAEAHGDSEPRKTGRILAIDDDGELLDLLAEVLRDAGHEVVTARSDTEAMKRIDQFTPDVIVSDFRLLGARDGLELAADLRARLMKTTGHAVPVIMLTGDIAIDALVRFAANEIVRLAKPVRLVELHAAIAAALGDAIAPAGLAAPAAAASQPAALPLVDDVAASAPPADAAVDAAADAAADADMLVHVIEDDPDALASFGLLLASSGLPAVLHASAEAFRSTWRPTTGGCLLIDACLPGESGLDLMRSLKASDTLPPSIVITGQGDIGMAVAAMKAGAIDFIEKPASGASIIKSIERAMASSVVTDASDEEARAARAAAQARMSTLTPRQREVMILVLDGHPSKNIAADLNLSQRTVENHRAEIMHRTKCRSLPELARLAMAADHGGVKLN